MSTDVDTLSQRGILATFGVVVSTLAFNATQVARVTESSQFGPTRSSQDFDMICTPEFMARITRGDGDIAAGRVYSTQELKKRLGL